MGKLTGIITGLASVTLLGFFVFSQYFWPLENWLAPIFGPITYVIFGLLFFLFANPLNYPILLISQIGIGLIIGVSARKGSRAVGAAISTYTLSWLIFILSAFYVVSQTGLLSSLFSGLSSSSGFGGYVAAIPPGTNLATIMGEPVIRRLPLILPSIQSGLSSGTGSGGTFSILSKFLPLLEPTIINFVLFVVFSGVFGLIIGKLLKRKPVGQTPAKVIPAAMIFIVALLVLFPAASLLSNADSNGGSTLQNYQSIYSESFAKSMISDISGLGSHTASPFDFGSSLYSSYTAPLANGSESATYLISRNGTLYTAYSFYDPATQGSNALSNLSGFSGVSFAFGIQMSSPENLFYGLSMGSGNSSSGGLSPTSVENLIPPEMLLLGYQANTSITQAQKAADSYFTLLGINNPVLIISLSGASFAGLSLPFGGNLYLFGSNTAFSSVAGSIASNLTGRIQSSGLMTALNLELQNGNIVPGSQKDPMGGTIILSGFMNSSMVGNMFSFTNFNQSSAIPNGSLDFLMAFAANDYAFNAQAGKMSLQLSQFIGSNSSFSFGNSGVSILMAAYPDANPYNTSIQQFPGYGARIFTDSANFTNLSGYNSSYGGVTVVSPGHTFSGGTQIGNITDNLTGKVWQQVAFNSISGNKLSLTVTIWDNSTLPIYNVSSSVHAPSSYNGMVTLLSGSVNKNISKISAGSSYTYNATISVNGSGKYFLLPSLVTYSYNGSNYARYSPGTSQQISGASYTHSYITIFDFLVGNYVGSTFVNIPGTPIPTFLLLIGLIIVLDVWLEVRALKRWLAHK